MLRCEGGVIDFTDVGPGFTIAGPPGTGRSTALVSIARSVLARRSNGHEVHVAS